MSRLIGSGERAVLIAGGLEAPDVVSRRRAVRHILRGFSLYERDGEHGAKAPVRGWRGLVFDALQELNPEAAAHLINHQDARATWLKFCAGPGMDDEENFEDP